MIARRETPGARRSPRFVQAGHTPCLAVLLGAALILTLGATPASAQTNEEFVDRAVYSLYASGVFRARNGDWAGALFDFERAYRVRPSSAELLVRYAEALWRTGRRVEATKYAERALSQDSTTADAWLILADAAIERSDAAAAEECLERRIAYKPDDIESRLRLGFLREGLGDFEGVVAAFRGYPSRRPGAAAAQFHLGVAYSRLGRREEARQAFRAALRENPSYVDAAQNVAVLSEELGDDSAAIAAWGRVVQLDPGREEALRRRIALLLQAERYEEAGVDLKALLRFAADKDGALRRILAQIAVRTGDLAVAARTMLDLADLRGSETGYLEVAVMAAQARTETDVLTRALERAWEIGLRPEVGRLLLTAYLSARDDTGAVRLLERLHAIRPDDTAVLWTLGLLHHRRGRTDDAERTMLAIVERDPQHAEAHNFVGYSWADRGVRLDEARDLVLRALELEPSNPEYIDSLGWVWFRMGRFEEAARQLERAVELSDDEPVILDHLGDAYRALGRDAEALEAYRGAEATGRHPDPEALRGKIRVLENPPAAHARESLPLAP